MLSLCAGKISMYTLPASGKRSKRHHLIKKEEISDEERAKNAAWRVKKRIYRTVQALYDCTEPKAVYSRKTQSTWYFKLNFVTLTLPGEQLHTDQEFHNKIFKDFIRALKRRHPSLLYIYRAETQENGNLHYHLVTNTFIHWKDLRDLWNYYLRQNGYRKHDDANSTDVHSLKNVDDPAAYIAKYITKEDDTRRKVGIKLWDCSKALKKVGNVVVEMPSIALSQEVKRVGERYNSLKHFEYCSVVSFKKEHLNYTNLLRSMYDQLLEPLRLIDAGVVKDLYSD
jgi:hypothetical protein